jgi:hypothetical protein
MDRETEGKGICRYKKKKGKGDSEKSKTNGWGKDERQEDEKKRIEERRGMVLGQTGD